MSFVFFSRFSCNQNIIQIYEKEVEILEYGIHEPLEGLGCIFKAEGHAKEFEQSKWRDHSSFWYLFRIDGHLVITSDQIDLAENILSGQVCSKVVEPRNWVAVNRRYAIYSTKIATRAPPSLRFRDHV